MEKREQRDRRHASRTLLARARHQQRLAGNHAYLSPHKSNQHPAMIAAFVVPQEPEPGTCVLSPDIGAVHLTLLKPDGSGKADVRPNKIMIGRSLGLPIVLGQPNDLLALAITEGVEDGLALHQALGMGAWAAGAAGRMPALAEAIPTYIEAVTIELHPDSGRRFAEQLAQTLSDRGVDVFTREAVA